MIILLKVFTIITMLLLGSVGGNIVYEKRIQNEIQSILSDYQDMKPDILTKDDIKHLPAPVQKYIEYTGCIGKEKAITVRLKQVGQMKMNEDTEWIPLEAEEYYTTDEPCFIWYGVIKSSPIFIVKGYDTYIDGVGNLVIKLFGLIKVADAKGPETDHGEAVRFLQEMLWFPSAFTEDYITWETIDDFSAKATLSYKNLSVTGIFYFNDNGEIVNFKADRYRLEGDEFILDTWETPITEYKNYGELRLPSKGSAIQGDFEYIKIELVNIEYNIPEIY